MQPVPPSPPSSVPYATAVAGPEGVPLPAGVPVQLDMSRCFADAIGVYRQNFWPLVVAAVLTGALSVLTLLVLVGPLCGGWAAMCLSALSRPDRRVDPGLLFSQGNRFGTLALLFVIGVLPEMVGVAAFVLPGLLLITVWLFAFPLAVDQNLSAVQALSCSARIVFSRGFGPHFMLGSLVLLLNVVPVFVPYVGWVLGWFTMPFGWLLLTSAYVQEVRERPADLGDVLPQGFEVRPVGGSPAAGQPVGAQPAVVQPAAGVTG